MSGRRAVLEAIAFGTDPKVSPGDRLKALEQLDGLGVFRSEAADDGLSEAQVWAEVDSFHSMMLSALFIAAGPDLTVDAAKFPKTEAMLRAVVDREVEREVANRELEAERRRVEREREQAEREADGVVDVESVDVAEVAAEAALPSPEPVRELPPGIDLGAGWPRPQGPGEGFARPGRR